MFTISVVLQKLIFCGRIGIFEFGVWNLESGFGFFGSCIFLILEFGICFFFVFGILDFGTWILAFLDFVFFDFGVWNLDLFLEFWILESGFCFF